MRIEALRTHLTCLALPALIAWPAAGLRAADEVARGAIVASAEVRARSAVHVSSDVLQFDVPDGGMPAVAAVRFKAGVRAASDADVQLLVSVTASPAVAVTIVPMDGGTDGPPAPLGSAPVMVARWNGGGLREGVLRIELRGVPGRYAVPVQLALNVR